MTETAAPLYHVVMSQNGKVVHLEDERTGRPMCGRNVFHGRRLGLLAVSDVKTPCRICIETEKFLSA